MRHSKNLVHSIILAAGFTFLLLFSFAPFQGEAAAQDKREPDPVPTDCGDFPNNQLCETAKQHQVGINKTRIIVLIADAESVAANCGYTLIDKFETDKANEVVTDNEKELFRYMLEEVLKAPEASEKDAWCRDMYSFFGPDGQEEYRFMK
jgi:hypothetical protein